MKRYLLQTLPLLLLLSCQETSEHKPVLADIKARQPVIIVNKNRHLKIPEFWIDQLKDPQKVIMDAKAIQSLNSYTAHTQHQLNLFEEIGNYYNGLWIKESIQKAQISLSKTAHYFEDSNPIKSDFFEEIKGYCNLDKLQNQPIKTRYALTVNYTNQRIIPTELALLKKRDQIHFDRNQNSALDIATPIAILHTTSDGLWHYGIAPTSSGWIKDSDIAFGDKKSIEGYLKSENFIVTTEPKTALMVAGSYHDYLRMGVRLPVIMTIDEMSMVLIPKRDKDGSLILANGTLKTANTHKGYLPYTAQNILLQAFKFLNAPYGWGGMYGEQDCSKFIQEVYATTGIKLPRNSLSQSEVGEEKIELKEMSREQKRAILSKLEVGKTILHLPGHIVLYIGEYKGEPYIIHTVWGSSRRHFALGRTAVTALSFNDYIQQLDRATTIQK
jgi:cell wall-associated NlpC family hydrolase